MFRQYREDDKTADFFLQDHILFSKITFSLAGVAMGLSRSQQQTGYAEKEKAILFCAGAICALKAARGNVAHVHNVTWQD